MKKFLGDKKYAYIYRLNTKIPLTMLCLSGFELYSRWVPLMPFAFIEMSGLKLIAVFDIQIMSRGDIQILSKRK